jgi:hypothetical protein
VVEHTPSKYKALSSKTTTKMHSISLNLSFLIYKIRTVTPSSLGRRKIKFLCLNEAVHLLSLEHYSRYTEQSYARAMAITTSLKAES